MGYRYIGSKSKLLGTLIPEISKVAPQNGHVLDLMSGTAATSLALAEAGFQVTAVDMMTYSYHHARSLLCFTSEPSFTKAIDFISKFTNKQIAEYEAIQNALMKVPGRKGYFWREFSSEGKPKLSSKPRNYFSPKNAKKIDGMRYWIKKLREEEKITPLEHSPLLHDLILAANDIANIAGTYGHYLSKLIGRANEPIRLKLTNLRITKSNSQNTVIKGQAEDIAASIKCDLCYIDPPYTKRQYAANYHVLETLAREDDPDAIGISGLRPWRDQYSNFCTKTKIRDSFRAVFSNMNCPYFIVSYSEDGLLKVEEIEELFSEFGTVSVQTLLNKRFKSNDSKLAPQLTEYLIHLQKISLPQISVHSLHGVGAK